MIGAQGRQHRVQRDQCRACRPGIVATPEEVAELLGERGATTAEALPTLTGEDLAAVVTLSDRLPPANLVAEAVLRRDGGA